MDVLIGYHRVLVEALLGIVFLNMLIPYLLRSNLMKLVKYTRIGYFAFWALWAMVAFSGLIVFIFMREPLTLAVVVMLAAIVILPLLDGYRAITLKKIWQTKQPGLSFNGKVLSLEALVIAATTAIAIIY